jgi:hypothetical protein
MRPARIFPLSAAGHSAGKAVRRLAAFVALAFVALALIAAGVERGLADDMISEPVAVLQGLDKITARASDFTAPVGTPVRFGNLSIVVHACDKNPPEDTPESAAFLQIDMARPGAPAVQEFSGWMFAESPALSSLEDPIYDVMLLDCKGANGSPPSAAAGSSDGKVVR